jgi:hypothetical protein
MAMPSFNKTPVRACIPAISGIQGRKELSLLRAESPQETLQF